MSKTFLKPSPNEEVALHKKILNEKRKQRILEVREQEKRITLVALKKGRLNKDLQIEALLSHLKEEFEADKEHKEEIKRKELLTRMKDIGGAHNNAKNKENYGTIKELSAKEKADTTKRYKRAMSKVLQEKKEVNVVRMGQVIIREKVNKMEQDRKKDVVSRPRPQPDLINMLRPVKVAGSFSKQGTLESFTMSHHHLSQQFANAYVEKPDENEQADAKVCAMEKELQTKIDKEKHDREIEERKEKAELRHTYARQEVLLKQQKNDLLEDLENLEMKDRQHRKQIVADIPKKVFQAPHQRLQGAKSKQLDLEQAFEKCYNVKTGDVFEHHYKTENKDNDSVLDFTLSVQQTQDKTQTEDTESSPALQATVLDDMGEVEVENRLDKLCSKIIQQKKERLKEVHAISVLSEKDKTIQDTTSLQSMNIESACERVSVKNDDVTDLSSTRISKKPVNKGEEEVSIQRYSANSAPPPLTRENVSYNQRLLAHQKQVHSIQHQQMRLQQESIELMKTTTQVDVFLPQVVKSPGSHTLTSTPSTVKDATVIETRVSDIQSTVTEQDIATQTLFDDTSSSKVKKPRDLDKIQKKKEQLRQQYPGLFGSNRTQHSALGTDYKELSTGDESSMKSTKRRVTFSETAVEGKQSNVLKPSLTNAKQMDDQRNKQTNLLFELQELPTVVTKPPQNVAGVIERLSPQFSLKDASTISTTSSLGVLQNAETVDSDKLNTSESVNDRSDERDTTLPSVKALWTELERWRASILAQSYDEGSSYERSPMSSRADTAMSPFEACIKTVAERYGLAQSEHSLKENENTETQSPIAGSHMSEKENETIRQEKGSSDLSFVSLGSSSVHLSHFNSFDAQPSVQQVPARTHRVSGHPNMSPICEERTQGPVIDDTSLQEQHISSLGASSHEISSKEPTSEYQHPTSNQISCNGLLEQTSFTASTESSHGSNERFYKLKAVEKSVNNNEDIFALVENTSFSQQNQESFSSSDSPLFLPRTLDPPTFHTLLVQDNSLAGEPLIQQSDYFNTPESEHSSVVFKSTPDDDVGSLTNARRYTEVLRLVQKQPFGSSLSDVSTVQNHNNALLQSVGMECSDEVTGHISNYGEETFRGRLCEAKETNERDVACERGGNDFAESVETSNSNLFLELREQQIKSEHSSQDSVDHVVSSNKFSFPYFEDLSMNFTARMFSTSTVARNSMSTLTQDSFFALPNQKPFQTEKLQKTVSFTAKVPALLSSQSTRTIPTSSYHHIVESSEMQANMFHELLQYNPTSISEVFREPTMDAINEFSQKTLPTQETLSLVEVPLETASSPLIGPTSSLETASSPLIGATNSLDLLEERWNSKSSDYNQLFTTGRLSSKHELSTGEASMELNDLSELEVSNLPPEAKDWSCLVPYEDTPLDGGSQLVSLQEAFLKKKEQFKKNSENRVKQVKKKAVEHYEKTKPMGVRRKPRRSVSVTSPTKHLDKEIVKERMVDSMRRTKSLYDRLPEVQKQADRRDREETLRKNREKLKEYHQKLQEGLKRRAKKKARK